ncbi:MAG: hypothetical protein EOP43_07910 [Sphingobacteriaceae bacterium]|nr:MAG: hypothetical protein EOP43_07910 [Sphingobacteriaceae bacterium]
MKEKLAARLFSLQRKLNSINIYNHENGNKLFRYSIEFESILSLLLKFNNNKFYSITNCYTASTQQYCELGCAFNEEINRKKAFAAGITEMDLFIRKSLEILAELG